MSEKKNNRAEEREERASTTEIKDLLCGFLLFVFGGLVVWSGVKISEKTLATSGTGWYGTPGMFPIFIGAVLMILSAVMVISLYRSGVRVRKTMFLSLLRELNDTRFIRLCLSVGLLALYVFVLLGTINYIMSTFLYLFVTMAVFRENGYALWKIGLISAFVTGFLYVFFNRIAGIPLP